MKYTVIEENNIPYIHLGNDWGFFVELDVPPQKQCVPFRKPRKYMNIPIPQGMETIKEETRLECFNEEYYNNNNNYSYKKKEHTGLSQLYSGCAICALAVYICFIV